MPPTEGCWAILRSKLRMPSKEDFRHGSKVPEATVEAVPSELATRCQMLELKVKGLQAQLRAYKKRDEEQERLESEPWALQHRGNVSESGSPQGLEGCARRAGGGVSPLCRLHAGSGLRLVPGERR